MSTTLWRVCTVGLLTLAIGCQGREPVEVTRDRATEAFLRTQSSDLKSLIAKTESGELVTQDRLAIGIAEDVVKQVLDASLPKDTLLGQRVALRIESAQPYFRGNNAALVFQAGARGVNIESATARLELGGTLERFRIDRGKLVADIELAHFKVLDTSFGSMAAGVLEGLVREHLGGLNRDIPSVEIPVHLEQSIQIGGLDEGVVMARTGALPLEMTVAEVIPSGQRLWVLLDAKAGPWQVAASAAAEK